MKKSTTKIILTTFLISLSFFCFFKSTPVKADSLTVKYNMDLELNADKKTLAGKEEVFIQNSSGADFNELVFHLYPDLYSKKETMPFSPTGIKNTPLTEAEKGDICIEKVLIDGKDTKFTQDNQVLKIVLEKKFKSNENVTVSVWFNLKIPKGTSRLSYSNDVYSLANWYPILSIYDLKENKWDETKFYPIGESNYSDISEYNINIKVPKDFVVVSTGKEKEISSTANSKVVNLTAKDTRDFVIMISPYFKCISKEIDGIKINSYYLSTDDKPLIDIAESVLDASVNAVKFFSQKFGKYPYDEFDIVESYYEGGAMEYPQLIQMPKYITSIAIPSSKKSLDAKPYIIQGAVHELCHQWWYVTIGNNEFKEPFLDEAFATFFTAYYFEKSEGNYSSNAVLRSLRYNFSRMAEFYPKILNLPCAGSNVEKFGNDKGSYVQSMYIKGPLILEDLRKKVGEDNFLTIMQTYFKEYKFKNASIEGFLNIIEKQAGTKVRDDISSEIYSGEYKAEGLKPTNEETKQIEHEVLKEEIKTSEQTNGSVLGSLLLRAENGEKITVVKPSSLTKEEETFSNDKLKKYFGDFYGKLSIRVDNSITEDDLKNSNVVIVGNPWNNKIFNLMADNLPLSISKTGVSTPSFSEKNDNISGMFATKNPKNDKNMILAIFWTKDASTDFYFDMYANPEFIMVESQFILSIDNKRIENGKF